MADVFISYSRKDKAFVQRLHGALAQKGKDVWVDWEDIPPTAEWLSEINAAIEAAQAFVFILSPDSLASEVCGKELTHALANNKRLIPIVCREIDPQSAPQALARINWIFFRAGDDFDAALGALISAIETDLDWVRDHTRLLTRAIEWEARKRDNSLLLRGQDLKAAEAWLGRSGQLEPRPTSLQSTYILAGRQAATRRQRIQFGFVATALVISIVLAVLAVRQAQIATSRELAAAALNQLDKDPELSLLLAAAAADRQPTRQAQEALRLALFESHVRVVMGGHDLAVTAVAYDHRGARLAGVWEDGSVTVWEASGGRTLLQIPAPEHSPRALVFTPDDQRLVVVDGASQLRIWDAVTGAPYQSAVRDVISVPFDFQGRTAVAVRSGDGITVADALTGQPIRLFRTGGNQMLDVAAVSPAGDYLATPGDPGQLEALLIDGHGAVASRLLAGDDPVWGVSFRPDGKAAVITSRWVHTESGGGPTAIGDKSAWIWPVPGGDGAPRELRGHTRQLNCANYSPNGLFVVTASDDGTARVWDAATGNELAVLRGHRGGVTSAAFSPDGTRIVTAGVDGTVRIWDAASGEESRPAELANKPLAHAVLSPDGRLAATLDYDDRAVVWEPLSGKRRFTIPGRTTGIGGISFSADGGRVATVSGDTVRVWSVADGALMKTVSEPASMGWERVVLNRDGTLLALLSGNERTASGEEPPRLISLNDGAGMVLQADGAPVYSLAFSPDGRHALTGGEEYTPRLWTLATKASQALAGGGHTDRVLGTAFSPDGKTMLTTSRDTTAKLWDVTTARKVLELTGHRDAVISGEFSPDGTLAATVGADGTLRLWDVTTGRQLALFGGFPGIEPAAAFAGNGRSLLALSQEGFIRRYELNATGTLEQLLARARQRATRALTAEERRIYLHE